MKTMKRGAGATPARVEAAEARRAGAQGRRRRRLRRLAIVVTTMVALGVSTASAEAAITISRSELNSAQLRVEGSGALPSSAVVVNPGSVTGTSDSTGAFKIQATPYSSSTCQVTVSDGSTSASASLAGCTPS